MFMYIIILYNIHNLVYIYIYVYIIFLLYIGIIYYVYRENIYSY